MVSVRKNTEKFFLQFYSQVLCKYSKGEPSSFSSNKKSWRENGEGKCRSRFLVSLLIRCKRSWSLYQPLDKARNTWDGSWGSGIKLHSSWNSIQGSILLWMKYADKTKSSFLSLVSRSWIQSFGKYHERSKKWMAEPDTERGPNSHIDASSTKSWFRHGGSWLADWILRII